LKAGFRELLNPGKDRLGAVFVVDVNHPRWQDSFDTAQ
jgi:hypothetical protein